MQLRTFTTGILLAAGAFAQTSSFPKPAYFRETFSKTQPKVELKDPVRLKDFVAGDKLELSLKNYLSLVVANNTDIQIQMLSLETPKNAIQRAFGAWDPRATANFTTTRSTTPPTSVLEGATTLKQLNQPLTMNVTQVLPTGTSYTASWGGSKTTSNSTFNNYNPALSSNLSIAFSQPLLQNRGSYVNHLSLMVVKSRLRGSEYNQKTQFINLISAAESAYWDVVSARENLRVAMSAENTAGEFLKLQQRQLELGALSPLDIYQAEQTMASRKLDVAQARFRLAQLEDALRKQIGADLDPDARKLAIVLTETVEVASTTEAVDREQMVQLATSTRPDLKAAMQNLDIDDLSIQQSRNALLPNLALTGNYTVNGRGGVFVHPRRFARCAEPDVRLRVFVLPDGAEADASHPVACRVRRYGGRHCAQEAGCAHVAQHAAVHSFDRAECDHQPGIQQGVGEASQDCVGLRGEEPGRRQQEVRVGHRTATRREQRAGPQGPGGVAGSQQCHPGTQEPDQPSGADWLAAGRARHRDPAVAQSCGGAGGKRLPHFRYEPSHKRTPQIPAYPSYCLKRHMLS
ncbi:MAG: TolC family protein [Candidatus Solibacter sp.]|nr:TolC family protein [Candidatus Solibacter sp.]